MAVQFISFTACHGFRSAPSRPICRYQPRSHQSRYSDRIFSVASGKAARLIRRTWVHKISFALQNQAGSLYFLCACSPEPVFGGTKDQDQLKHPFHSSLNNETLHRCVPGISLHKFGDPCFFVFETCHTLSLYAESGKTGCQTPLRKESLHRANESSKVQMIPRTREPSPGLVLLCNDISPQLKRSQSQLLRVALLGVSGE